jgi:hypothetical protein
VARANETRCQATWWRFPARTGRTIAVVAAGSSDDAQRLDPVLVEALKQLRSFTYRRRRLERTAPVMGHPSSPGRGVLGVVKALAHLRPEAGQRSLDGPGARAGAVHLFKHLKHHGYTWNPADVHAWALSHGFVASDAEKLAVCAQGVQDGTRYHTQPDPFGRHAIFAWRREAERQQ